MREIGDIIEYAKAGIAESSGVSAARALLSTLNESRCVEPICVACSGGSDSVFLLEYAASEFPNLRKSLVLLHFNHNLRGAESDGDEKFVENLAIAKNMKFRTEKLKSVPINASEGYLRGVRNDFFERTMNDIGSKILLLGHQKNDVAETLLMRLARASDTDGLSAPRAVTVFRENYVKLRPLLDISKAEIENFLKKSAIQWRIDGSNYKNNFLRNRIRNIVLPRLQDACKGFDVVENLSSAKKNIEEAGDAVTFFAKKYLAGRNLSGEIEISDLVELPFAVLRMVFAAFLSANGIGVRRSILDLFLEKIRRGDSTPFSVGKERFAELSGRHFRIVGKNARENWSVENLKIGENALPNGRVLKIEEVDVQRRFPGGLKSIDPAVQCCAAIAKNAKIAAKNYRPNYRFIPFDHHSEKKLGDVLTAKILPKEKRHSLPVILVDGEVCWVPTLPVSNIFRAKEKKVEVLLLTYL
jgi:tRNA(Ile)-lysidine synthase